MTLAKMPIPGPMGLATDSSDGGGLAGYGLGASVGRPMADRIFLIVSSVLISAMRRRGLLQRGQIVSISNVFRSSSLHEI
jgi:hypothetical protein